jgi:hypothetical protein
MVSYLANNIKMHNYGQIDEKLVIIDVDIATLSNSIIRK